ncbi:TfuA-like protein [Streptomyces olivaceoviridis]
MTTTYVFLGPSLPVDEARDVLDAHYLPPVSCGDITDLVLDREPPDVIAIVDGLFEQVPAVWHKEILFALSRGVRVFGSSSMGALRAAELHSFGMEGVGGVFEAFRDGRYTDDDEVTIVHAPAENGYRPLSEAMVNLRLGLAGARDAGHLGARTHDRLVALAKGTFYPDRSWPRLLQDGRRLGLPAAELDALRAYVRDTAPDAKAGDARALLARVRQVLDEGCTPFRAEFDFEPTYYWEKLTAVVRQQRAERRTAEVVGAPAARLLDHVTAEDPAVVDAALLDLLIRQEAARLGISPSAESLDRHAARYPHLAPDAPEAMWLAERDALREVLVKRLRSDLTDPVLRELAAGGRLAATRGALESAGTGTAAVPVPDTGRAAAVPLPNGRRE